MLPLLLWISLVAPPPPAATPVGVLEFGQQSGRAAIYLRATQNFSLSGLAFSLGVPASTPAVSYVAASMTPSVLDTSVPGKLALAFLNTTITAQTGDRLVLGYVVTTAPTTLKFFGSSANDSTTGAVVPVTIGSASTVTLQASLPTPQLGQQETITATLAPTTASGTVTFYNGTTVLGTVPLVTGVAQLKTAPIPAGANSIVARYSGDATYATQNSAALALPVHTVLGTSFVGSQLSTSFGMMVVADFNGDGKADVATIGTGSLLSVYLGNGDGTFQTAFSTALTSGTTLAVGDFDGDGKTDIFLVTSRIGFGVFYGNGDGTFFYQDGPNNSAGDDFTGTVAKVMVADFDGDGLPDLAAVILNGSTLGNYVSILRGGHLTQPHIGQFYATRSTCCTFASLTDAATGDFNGDGMTDLLVIGPGFSRVYLGNGDRTFTPTTQQTQSFSASSQIVTGDFNGDGKTDFATINASGGFSVLLGNGDGTFQTALTQNVPGAGAVSLARGDFNADGVTDLAVLVPNSGVYIYPGTGNGTFQTPVLRVLPGTPNALFATELSGDGRTDLIVNSGSAGSVILLGAASAPLLSLSATHSGNFEKGVAGGTLTLTVSNGGTGPTLSAVSVTDTLPTGLTATAISGSGWNCTIATLTCSRSDALAASASYAAINITVSVASNAAASVLNAGSLSGGGDLPQSASDTVLTIDAPDLTIMNNHIGTFTQGQVGATYALHVTNSGLGATFGQVSVVDSLPPSLAATAIAGSGWNCTIATLTCTRSDVLAAGASYANITVTVNVASNAPASVTNSATVSGGGEVNTGNNSANDTTPITQVADLTIASSHTGTFVQREVGATYLLVVTNAGAGPTSGQVLVADALPIGLTATAIAGSGWSCVVNTVTCTRSDALAASSSYPAITVTVTVAATAALSVTNNATVAGGGELNSGNDSATDATMIVAAYVVGDVMPHIADTSGSFGDGATNTVDLLEMLRAVTLLPGFVPATCSDRFDAMDGYPADGANRGGDGVLDTLDLLTELRRVSGIDTSAPVRTARGLSCSQAQGQARRAPLKTQGSLELGADGSVYLRATSDLSLAGFGFSLGGATSKLQFTAASAAPAVVDNAVTGSIALLWVNAISLRAGERILLGRVTGGDALHFFGVSANASVSGHGVGIALPKH